jgi:hypothetical protein
MQYNNKEYDRCVSVGEDKYSVVFNIGALVLSTEEAKRSAAGNEDPSVNYVMICEKKSSYFKIGGNHGRINVNDINNGSTASHEIAHGLGLEHADGNFIGKGIPHIMLPRGSHVSCEYQYNPSIMPGYVGSAMNPSYRRVTDENILDILKDIDLINNDSFIIGSLTNKIYDTDE